MLRVYIKVIDEFIEVSDEGQFRLPPMEYDLTLLNKIARELRKAMRTTRINDLNEEC